MTDTSSKRAGIGGRPPVATPRVNQNSNSNSTAGAGAASSLNVTEAALSKAVGARCQVKYRPTPDLVLSTTGYVDTISRDQHQVIIRERPNGGELRLISIHRVLELTVLDQPKAETMPQPVVPLTQREIDARVHSELAKAQEAKEHQGQGVDKHAQDLYDALRRMLPGCKWSGKNFIVNETALVEPPYGSDNVRPVDGVKGAEKNVAYVKKVLERLVERGNSGAAQSPGPRKGG